jgi:hypothetical protein
MEAFCRVIKIATGSPILTGSAEEVPYMSNFRNGSWPCKNAFPRGAGEKPGPVRSQATIAAISGLIPTMFMTRARL